MRAISRCIVFLPLVFRLLEWCKEESGRNDSTYLADEERAIRLCFAHTAEQVDLVQTVSARHVVSKCAHRRWS